MVDLGEPFISLNDIYKYEFRECSALTRLAHGCGYIGDTMDVVEKVILLLNRKADISCRDKFGDTVLHTLLKSKRCPVRKFPHHTSRGGLLLRGAKASSHCRCRFLRNQR